MKAEYVPDSGRLVPSLIVLPVMPWVRVDGSHCDVSMTAVVPVVAPVPPAGVVGLVVLELLRPLPHAATTRAKSSAERHRPHRPNSCRGRTVGHGVDSFHVGGLANIRHTRAVEGLRRRRRIVAIATRRPPPTSPSGRTYMSRINPMPKIAGRQETLDGIVDVPEQEACSGTTR